MSLETVSFKLRATAPATAASDGSSIERARDALAFIDPHDRKQWVDMAFALKAEFGDAGFDVWDEWGSEHKRPASEIKATWRSAKPGGAIQFGTLIYRAKEKGFEDGGQYSKPSRAEIEKRKQAAAERAAAYAAEEAAAQAAAAETAGRLWKAAAPATEHPYLTSKGVKAHGLRVGKWERVDAETGEVIVTTDQALLIPLLDKKRNLHSLQAIYPEQSSKKLYLKDGLKRGNFHPIGKPQTDAQGRLVFTIGEGYATCASVHEATGHMALVCFDVSNLMAVAQTLREAQPEAVILIAADNDLETEGNPGVTTARKVAEAIGGRVAVPVLASDAAKACDFNDLAQAEGHAAVAAIITAALVDPAPVAPKHVRVVLVPTHEEALGVAYARDCLVRLDAEVAKLEGRAPNTTPRELIIPHNGEIQRATKLARSLFPSGVITILAAPGDEVEAQRVAQEFGVAVDLPPADSEWRGWGEHFLDTLFAAIDAHLERDVAQPASVVHTDLPEIELHDGERARIVQELAAAFSGSAPYYRRDALLVRAITLPADDETGGVWRSRGSVVLRQATTHAVISDASRYAKVLKYDGRSARMVPKDLPEGVAASFCATAVEENVLPSIIGVVRCPILREDGSLHIHRGYDPATRLILAGDEDWSELDVPERPTFDDAKSALQWLLDTAFADFPFADEASRSVAVSALLTAVIRPAIPCAPVHAFSAPQYGAGKSLQAEFAAIVATGVKPGMVAPGHSQEEFEKRVDAAIIEGDPVVVLDNLSRPLSGDNLCAAITSDTAKVRPLGSSVSVKVRTAAFWMVTGMNLSVKRDMHRRTVIGYIDAGMERPETRSGFKIADLKEWAAQNRMRILRAVYTMLRAHAHAGFPAVGEKALGNFEDWSRRVANCLVWLGQVNPVRSQERLRADDPEIQNRIALFRALVGWQETRKAIGSSSSWTIHDLRSAVSGSMGGDNSLGDAISAGVFKGIEGVPFWTRSNKNVTVGDDGVNYKLQSMGGARGGVVRWEVVVTGTGPAPSDPKDEPPI